MDESKRSLGALFGGLREDTCKGNRPFEAYAKRIGCVCVCVCVESFPLNLGYDDGRFHSLN